MATILLYINAVLGLVFGTVLVELGELVGLAGLVGLGAAGYGIANERKWGYGLGVAVVGIELAILGFWLARDVGLLLNINFILLALWPVVLMALLRHPQSREYQRIWFK